MAELGNPALGPFPGDHGISRVSLERTERVSPAFYSRSLLAGSLQGFYGVAESARGDPPNEAPVV
jgi:hypothetical protein